MFVNFTRRDIHQTSAAYQHAVLHGPGGAPVEHARAVVLHLGLLEVEVLGLVVGDAGLDAARARVGAAGRPGRRTDRSPGSARSAEVSRAQERSVEVNRGQQM